MPTPTGLPIPGTMPDDSSHLPRDADVRRTTYPLTGQPAIVLPNRLPHPTRRQAHGSQPSFAQTDYHTHTPQPARRPAAPLAPHTTPPNRPQPAAARPAEPSASNREGADFPSKRLSEQRVASASRQRQLAGPESSRGTTRHPWPGVAKPSLRRSSTRRSITLGGAEPNPSGSGTGTGFRCGPCQLVSAPPPIADRLTTVRPRIVTEKRQTRKHRPVEIESRRCRGSKCSRQDRPTSRSARSARQNSGSVEAPPLHLAGGLPEDRAATSGSLRGQDHDHGRHQDTWRLDRQLGGG
jgi:hypothetical protein